MSITLLKFKIDELSLMINNPKPDDVAWNNAFLKTVDKINDLTLQMIVPPPPTQEPHVSIYCDGGCLNNQVAEKRQAYGSFKIYEEGKATFFKFKEQSQTLPDILSFFVSSLPMYLAM